MYSALRSEDTEALYIVTIIIIVTIIAPLYLVLFISIEFLNYVTDYRTNISFLKSFALSETCVTYLKPRLYRQHVVQKSNMLLATCCLYLGNVDCIPLYPATDGQQTGNNFVDGRRQQATCCRATCCPGVNAA